MAKKKLQLQHKQKGEGVRFPWKQKIQKQLQP